MGGVGTQDEPDGANVVGSAAERYVVASGEVVTVAGGTIDGAVATAGGAATGMVATAGVATEGVVMVDDTTSGGATGPRETGKAVEAEVRSDKKSRSDSWAEARNSVKEKDALLNTTCQEMMTRLEERSRQRCPLWWKG